MFEEIITTYLIPALATLLSGVITYLGVRIKAVYEKKINTEEKQKVVETTVKYIEQVFKDLHGKEKLNKCKEKAMEWLNEKGISISEVELDILIESTVNKINESK